MSQQQTKRKQLYVTKLKAGQVVKTAKSEFKVESDEISIYIPEDLVLKAGDKLYLNPVKEYYDRLAQDGKMTTDDAAQRVSQCQSYNQPYVVSIWNKKPSTATKF